ncbi:hypothetical protein BH24ACI5_BH24ACI5_09080 [soil metagenome]
MTPLVLSRVPSAIVYACLFIAANSADGADRLIRAGDDLQSALNAAQPGDTLYLEAGATFTGNFVLPVKSGDTFITVRTATPDAQLPGPGTRITPAHAGLLPKIRSDNTMAALRTAPGAHHWRLMLLEFPGTREGYYEILQLGDGSAAQTHLSQVPYELELDRLYIHGDPLMGQKRGIALNARAVTIRNCYISEIKALGADTQAIGGWNGPGPFTIENNYLEAAGENFMLGGADPFIANLVSDNVVFRHNHVSRPMSWRDPVVPTPIGLMANPGAGGTLEPGTHRYRVVARRRVGSGAVARSTASTEVTASVSGGGVGSVTLTWTPVPDTTEYFIYSQSPSGALRYWKTSSATYTDGGAAGTAGAAPTSSGSVWTVKNLFELKNARNVLIENNVFENNWAGAQSGYAIVLTPRNQDGKCSWCVVENVTFQRNLVRNVAAGINIMGYDDIAPSAQTRNIRIQQNLMYGVTRSLGGHGWFLLMGDEPRDLVVDHNTVDAYSNAIFYVYGGSAGALRTVSGFQFTNNAVRHNDYGMNAGEVPFGNGVIDGFFPGGIVNANWLSGAPASRYPASNYFTGEFDSAFVNPAGGDYSPAPGSILVGRATDGTNIGANVGAIMATSQSVVAGRLGAVRLPPPTNLRIVTK